MLDMKLFKKVKEDTHTVTMRHEKGHEVKIVKRALSAKARKMLNDLPQGYAEGGDVEEPKPEEQVTAPPAPEAAPAAVPHSSAPVTINIGTPPAAVPPPAPVAPQPTAAQSVGQSFGENLKTGFMNSPEGLAARGMAAAAPYVKQGVEGIKAGFTGEALPDSGSPDTTAAPAAPTNYEPQAPASHSPEAPAPAASNPGMEMTQNYQKAMTTGLAGIEKQSQAEQGLAKETQGVHHTATQSLVDLESETKQRLATNAHAIETTVQDIRDNLIDPSHYLENRSTGDKVRTAIGMILGGAGSGVTGGPNPVLEMLNKQIDRDLKAQERNMGAKENLLSVLQHQTGDIRSAADTFRLIRAQTIAHQIDEAAAKAGTPMAQAKALQAKSALYQQYAPIMLKSALMSAVSDIARSGDPDAATKMLPQLRMYAPDMAKDIEGRLVPGVGLAAVPLDTKTRDTLEARTTLQTQVHALRQFAKQHEGTVLDRATIEYGHTLSKTVQDAYRRANGQGVFKESESKFVNGIVADDPTAFFNRIRVDPKLRALEDSNLSELNGLRRSVGLPAAKGALTPVQRPPNFSR